MAAAMHYVSIRFSLRRSLQMTYWNVCAFDIAAIPICWLAVCATVVDVITFGAFMYWCMNAEQQSQQLSGVSDITTRTASSDKLKPIVLKGYAAKSIRPQGEKS